MSSASCGARRPIPAGGALWWAHGGPDLSREEVLRNDMLAEIDEFVDLSEAERIVKPMPVMDKIIDEFLAEKRPVLAPASVRSFTWAACLKASPDGQISPPVLASCKPGFRDVHPNVTRNEFVGNISSVMIGYEVGDDPLEVHREQLFAEQPKDALEFQLAKLLPEDEDDQQDWQVANVIVGAHIACRFRAKDGGVRALWVGETLDATDRFQARWQRFRFDHHVRSALRHQLLLKEAAKYMHGATTHEPSCSVVQTALSLLKMEDPDVVSPSMEPVTLGAVVFSSECAIKFEETSVCGLEDYVTFSNHDEQQVSHAFLRRNVVLPLLDSACLAGNSCISLGVQRDQWVVTCRLTAGTSAQMVASEQGVVLRNVSKPPETFSAYSALCAVVRDCKKLNIAVRIRSVADSQDGWIRCVSISIPLQTTVTKPPSKLEFAEGNDGTKQDRRSESSQSPRKAKRPRQDHSRDVRPPDPSSFVWVLIEDQRVLAQLQKVSLAKHFGIRLNVIQSPEEVSKAPEAILKIFAGANDRRVILLMDENVYTVGNDTTERVPHTATQIRDELFQHAHLVEAVATKKLVLVSLSANSVEDNRLHVFLQKTVPTEEVVKNIVDFVST